MICATCGDFVLSRSRTPDLCRRCESESIAAAAKEPDGKTLTLSEVAIWIQSGSRPHRYKKAWKAQ